MQRRLNKIKAQRRVLRLKKLARELQCRLDAKDAEAKELSRNVLETTATISRLDDKLNTAEVKLSEWRTKYDALYRATFGSGIQNTESPRTVCRDMQITPRIGVPLPAFMLSVKRVELPCWGSSHGGFVYRASMAIEHAAFLTPFSASMIMDAVKDMLDFAQNGGDQ